MFNDSAIYSKCTYRNGLVAGKEGGIEMWRRLLGVSGIAAMYFQTEVKCMGERIEGLPEYSAEEVAKHDREENGVWVTYQYGVYDITEFIEAHPGGREKILKASGGSLEPYWVWFQQHYDNELVAELLDEMRIGNLRAEDRVVEVLKDPYANEPPRSERLKVQSENPMNAELPMDEPLSYITPADIFYIRHHLPVPIMRNHKLRVVYNDEIYEFSVEDIKSKFAPVEIIAVMQCGGNRRNEMNEVRKVRGGRWDNGAISNAKWKGVLLKDIVAYVSGGGEVPAHVEAEGADCDVDRCYAISIPSEYVMEDGNDIIIAYEMNDTDIPLDHGFPLRLVVPGVVGARSVKWLSELRLQDRPCTGHWQYKDYKIYPDDGEVAYEDYEPIHYMPVTSSTTYTRIEGDELVVSGYAYSGGGNRVERVDVSIDGGEQWMQADLQPHPPSATRSYKDWGWTLWEKRVKLPEGMTEVEVICKAIDSANNSQPNDPQSIWNIRGLLNNAWHRHVVRIGDEREFP